MPMPRRGSGLQFRIIVRKNAGELRDRRWLAKFPSLLSCSEGGFLDRPETRSSRPGNVSGDTRTSGWRTR